MPHVQLWGKMKMTLINTDLDKGLKERPKERLPAEQQCGGKDADSALVCGSHHCLQSWLQRVVFFLPHGLGDAFIQNMLLYAPLLAPGRWLVCPCPPPLQSSLPDLELCARVDLEYLFHVS